MESGTTAGELDVGGLRVRITSLDRVLFPQTGTTKGELLDYYVRIADAMLPHLRERPLHMHRHPEGVDGPRFWQKARPPHRPDWMPVALVWSRDKDAYIEYCVVNELASLLWAVNLGSIELHTSLHTCHDLHRPTMLAFDLDPGEGAGVAECGEVALRLKGPLRGDRPHPARQDLRLEGPTGVRAAGRAHDLRRDQAHRQGDRRAARARSARRGRVTHCEDLLVFEMGDVLDRVDRHGDLFEPLAVDTLPP